MVALQQFHILLIEVLVAENVDRIRPEFIQLVGLLCVLVVAEGISVTLATVDFAVG